MQIIQKGDSLMSIESTVKQAIKSRQEEIAKREKEICYLKERIRQMEEHPEMCITLEEIMAEIMADPEYANKENKKWVLYKALKNLTVAYGYRCKYQTLFEVSMATEDELLRRCGFGIGQLNQVKLLLEKYGLSLAFKKL